jgi:hypothetical protein
VAVADLTQQRDYDGFFYMKRQKRLQSKEEESTTNNINSQTTFLRHYQATGTRGLARA